MRFGLILHPGGAVIHEYLVRLYRHMAWADERVLAWATDNEPLQPAIVRLISHVLAAERVWLLRLREQDSTTQPVWPELAVPEMEWLARDNASAYLELLGATREEDLGAEVVYSSSSGATFTTARLDILTQVALHGSYHRGQIALLIREHHRDPVNTDYITFAREL